MLCLFCYFPFVPDNPSYFTVPGGSKFSLLRRRGLGAGSPPLTPSAFPGRRPSRALLRSVSAHSDASLLVLGNPRLCDLAPTHRPAVTASASDLAPDDDGEVFLNSEGDVRYYNLTRRRRHSFGEFLRTSSTATSPAVPTQPPNDPRRCHSSRKRCDKCSEKGQLSTLPNAFNIFYVLFIVIRPMLREVFLTLFRTSLICLRVI